MTLLLVDDQINVINGLMNGINYRKLEIDTVLPSTSVQEAKTLICENQIDILMTDIEMPGENGLQLLHWVSENYPDIVCILLTSHADFPMHRKVSNLDVLIMLFSRLLTRKLKTLFYVQLQKSIQKLKKSILQRWSFLYKSQTGTD